MSEEQKTEQTVVEKTDATAKPPAEEIDARKDDLDAILAEYDKANPPRSDDPKPEPKTDDGTGDLRDEMKALREEMAQREFKADMKNTVKDIRGELDPDAFDDHFMEAWLDGQARRDPRLQKAWLDRHDNPQRFTRIKQELARSFADRFSKLPDRNLTDDAETVAAHVRGASSNKAPEPKAPDYSGLSDQEFAESVKKDHGFRPPV